MTANKPLALVLEDDTASADALALVLADWGADVVHGPSLAALKAAAGRRLGEARFIITDFHLGPGPDGVSLVRKLVARSPQIRVLVLSGSSHGQALAAADQAGFESMRKPARAADIIAWLERN